MESISANEIVRLGTEYAEFRHAYLARKLGKITLLMALDEEEIMIDAFRSLSPAERQTFIQTYDNPSGRDTEPSSSELVATETVELENRLRDKVGNINGFHVHDVEPYAFTALSNIERLNDNVIHYRLLEAELTDDGKTVLQKKHILTNTRTRNINTLLEDITDQDVATLSELMRRWEDTLREFKDNQKE